LIDIVSKWNDSNTFPLVSGDAGLSIKRIAVNPNDQAHSREFFASGTGFVLAAAGSAVGLGNMWRFSYMTAEGGGAAFVLLYLMMTFLIGVPVMAIEFAIGRRARCSPIGAVRQIGGRGWGILGYLLVLTPVIILAYFSVIAGWALHYAVDAISSFSAAPSERFAAVSTGAPAIAYHLALMSATILIVMFGVRKGIERAAVILMPILFIILIGLALWAASLPGAEKGYSFYLQASFEEMLNPTVFRQAASQAFLSLSVGMGVMITYSSYLSRQENLVKNAMIVSMADFSVAFIAGLVVFPIIFALGISEEINNSTVGTLFISIPHAFQQMGMLGQVVGLAFFLVLAVAGLTSSVSLLEVGTASIIDEFNISRKTATLLAGVGAAIIGIFPAISQGILGHMDKISGELLVIFGALGMAVLGGWIMKDPQAELAEGASPLTRRGIPVLLFLVRYLVPAFLLVILALSLKETAAQLLS
jgi:NSS family neurotransmitter:Na+ symporter